jgi:predicted ArsR family transcriptional regulator
VDVISEESQEHSEISAFSESREEDVLALLRRRPCTSEDVAEGLGIHIAEALKRLNALTAIGTVRSTISGGRNFYTATGGKSPSGAPGNKQDK